MNPVQQESRTVAEQTTITAELTPVLPEVVTGVLHGYIAFDWGEEVHFDRARQLVGGEAHSLPRKSRTPSSISYRPLPLRFGFEPLELVLPVLGEVRATSEATVFDFGGVSIALHLPFQLPADDLVRLAGALSDPDRVIEAVRTRAEPLFQQLLPAIDQPLWSSISEEHFVFELGTGTDRPEPARLLTERRAWLAGLLRLESSPLSSAEVEEALQLHMSYGPDDLIIADWAATVLIDPESEEILEAIAFANLQLLEFRMIDDRLDDRLQSAYGLIHSLARTWLPFWRSQARQLRLLGELKVEANEMLERSSNVLKLVGDQYLARVYQMFVKRFHLEEWGQNVRQSISVAEGIYQVLSDQAATYRIEALEWIIILLIAGEILMSLGAP